MEQANIQAAAKFINSIKRIDPEDFPDAGAPEQEIPFVAVATVAPVKNRFSVRDYRFTDED